MNFCLASTLVGNENRHRWYSRFVWWWTRIEDASDCNNHQILRKTQIYSYFIPYLLMLLPRLDSLAESIVSLYISDYYLQAETQPRALSR